MNDLPERFQNIPQSSLLCSACSKAAIYIADAEDGGLLKWTWCPLCRVEKKQDFAVEPKFSSKATGGKRLLFPQLD